MKVCIFGQGFVATLFQIGVHRIARGDLEPYGVPLAAELSYPIEAIEFVGSFDVDADKVGRNVGDIAARYWRGPAISGLDQIPIYSGVHLGELRGLPITPAGLDDEATLLECVEQLLSVYDRIRPDVFVNLCTTERPQAFESANDFFRAIRSDGRSRLVPSLVYYYSVLQYARDRPAAFVNCIPTSIANDPIMERLARTHGVVLFGDDGASGATPLMADLLEHERERNRLVQSIAQFNIGGNYDFLALTDRERNIAKEQTKSATVREILGYDAPHYIKPTGYLEPLGDKKFVAMHLPYVSFNGAEDELFITARMNDSPALAGLLVDLVRLGQLCLDAGISGAVNPVNAFYMKSPGPADIQSISRILAYFRLRQWLAEIQRPPAPVEASPEAQEGALR